MSLAQGRFPLFSSSRLVAIITASLFAVGIASASLVLYQQYVKSQSPVEITREQAIAIAVQEADRLGFKPAAAGDNVVSAKLVHVDHNSLGLVMDEYWMRDTFTMTGRLPPSYKNQYIWQVEITASQPGARNLGNDWESWIDATNGTVLVSTMDGAVVWEKGQTTA